MGRWLAFLSLALLAFGLAACASNDTMADGKPRESTIPWNKPQSWEGGGVYGSALNQGQ